MAHCRRRAALPSTDRWFVSRPMHVREQSSLKALLAFGQLAHLWYTYGALEASFSARACHGAAQCFGQVAQPQPPWPLTTPCSPSLGPIHPDPIRACFRHVGRD